MDTWSQEISWLRYQFCWGNFWLSFFQYKDKSLFKKENSLRWMLIVKIVCICWLLLLIIAYHPASSISAIFRIRTSSTIFKNYKGSLHQYLVYYMRGHWRMSGFSSFNITRTLYCLCFLFPFHKLLVFCHCHFKICIQTEITEIICLF